MSRKTTFEYNGATFELLEDTVGSRIDSEYVARIVCPNAGRVSDRVFRKAMDFGAVMARLTLLKGDPGFVMPTLDDSDEAILAFYAVYQQLPGDFRNYLNIAQTKLMQPANDPDLTHGIPPKKTEIEAIEDADKSSSSPSIEPFSDSLGLASD